MSRRRTAVLPGLAALAAVLAIVLVSAPGYTAYWGELLHRATIDHRSSYGFSRVDPATGAPVTWPRCSPIPYAVNPQNAPPDWERIVDTALAEVGDASGYTFATDGTTESRRFLHRHASRPVLIGWATEQEYAQLAGGTLGFGGPTMSLVEDDRLGYVTGKVVLDADDYARLSAAGQDDEVRLVLVHEILHVLGLGHVDDPSQLMYPRYQGQAELGVGDRAGLEGLAGPPCG